MKHIAHNILAISFVALLSFSAAPSYAAESMDVMTEQDLQAVTITVNESTLYVKNAEKMVLEVYNVAGDKVYTTRIDSQSKTIELGQLSRGCYIIKIGKVVRKVYLK